MSDDPYDIGDLSDAPRSSVSLTRRWYVRLVFAIIVLSIIVVASGAFAAYVLYDHITQPRAKGERVLFTVPQGSSGNDVGRLLAKEGLIEHEFFFRVAMRLEPSNDAIKHGDFMLPKGVSPVQLLEILRTTVPQVVAAQNYRVTIPEGLTIKQMAQLSENQDGFMAAVQSLDLFDQFGISAISAEGFLMPNTYFFSEEPSDNDVVQRMADQFSRDFDALLEKYPDQKEVDRVSILTIASLIEEEARVDEERALVAAVIHNRLSKKMRLEMDSTLQYILEKYGQRILNDDKEVQSPYNTYMNYGLPPGPISNPGVKSIEAAMNPADVDYLFFVSNADGNSHTFSTTLREHNAAVAKYRREMRTQRREQNDQ